MNRKRILILRPDHLGDVVLFSSALRHIRNLYPSSRITLCVSQGLTNFAELAPYIDEIISWQKLAQAMMSPPSVDSKLRYPILWRLKGALQKWEWWRLKRKYRAHILLLPVRSPRGAVSRVVAAIPAPIKVGIVGDTSNQSGADGKMLTQALTQYLDVHNEPNTRHEIDVTRDFLRLIGANVSSAELWPEMWTDENDKDWATTHVPVVKNPSELILGLAPGVNLPQGKQVSEEWYAAVLNGMSEMHFRIVIFGTADDRDICHKTLLTLKQCSNVHEVIDYSGKTTIRQMIEGVRKCDLLLLPDAAVLHIAVALHKPCVGILGGGHYGRFYPWGDPNLNRVVVFPMPCFHCNWKCIYPEMRCILNIAPADAAKELTVLAKFVLGDRLRSAL